MWVGGGYLPSRCHELVDVVVDAGGGAGGGSGGGSGGCDGGRRCRARACRRLASEAVGGVPKIRTRPAASIRRQQHG